MAQRRKPVAAAGPTPVEAVTHDDKRLNIPTADAYEFVDEDAAKVETLRYPRDPSLDPQLVWKGKDEQDATDLVVDAPPIFIQEKIDPRVLIENLRDTAAQAGERELELTLFDSFDGLEGWQSVEFYRHPANWSNRMILGDSLHVMASLADKEDLRGQVQMVYVDPPYGIKFGSNWQVSTRNRNVIDGKLDDATREVEQIKAFRDTWELGIHSYLAYLRDRLILARDLLTESGSIFVQIGDENAHLVKSLLDEVFGNDNYCAQVVFRKTTGKGSALLDNTYDILLWYAQNRDRVKYRSIYQPRTIQDDSNLRFVELLDGTRRPMTREEAEGLQLLPSGARAFRPNPLTNQRPAQGSDIREFMYDGHKFTPGHGTFRTDARGLSALASARRLLAIGNTLTFIRYLDDFPFKPRNDIWDDTRQSGFGETKVFVVQTTPRAIERCLLMTTDPGDLVLDPTCGSGTTAYVAEQWGRRWITIDTSRVALALARARIMGTRYPYYFLADSKEGQVKEGEVTHSVPSEAPTHDSVRQGFVYRRCPYITSGLIANNSEIDVMWRKFQSILEPLRQQLNAVLNQSWEEWEIPRSVPAEDERTWSQEARNLHARWWEQRNARQREMDTSIAAKADPPEYFFDKPYEDNRKVRVAGPFTVE